MREERVAAFAGDGEVLGAEGDRDAAVGFKQRRRAQAVAEEPRSVVQEQVVAIATPVAQDGFRCVDHGAGSRRPAHAPRGKLFGRNPHIQRDDSSRCGHRGFSQARLADPRYGGKPRREVVHDANARLEEEAGFSRRQVRGEAGYGIRGKGERLEARGERWWGC